MSLASIHNHHNTSVMTSVSPDLLSFQNPSNFQTAAVTPKTSLSEAALLLHGNLLTMSLCTLSTSAPYGQSQ